MLKHIIYIDPATKQLFSFDGQNIVSINKPLKKAFTGSRLLYNDVISHSFKIDKDNLNKDLHATVEIKMYEEAGLHLDKEYKIIFLQKALPFGNQYLIESFAIEKKAVAEKYHPHLEQVKYIDFMALPFLVFEGLYTNQILKAQNDLFIHLDDSEAFIAFYQKGSLVSTKKIAAIQDFVQQITSQSTLSIDIEQLKKIIIHKGFVKENYSLDEYDIFDHIQTVFSKVFTKIENILLHTRNIFGYEKVDRIYFNLDNYEIPGLAAFISTYQFDAPVHTFDFLPDVHQSVLEFITALYIHDKYAAPDDTQNLTIFERKPPFYKTETGKLLLIAAASLVLFGTYPSYQQYEIYSLKQEKEVLQSKYQTVTMQAKKLKDKLKKSEHALAAFDKQKKELDNKIETIGLIADKLSDLAPNSGRYTDLIHTVNHYLKKYKLKTRQITQTDKNHMDIQIYADGNTRDTIAKFMHDLLAVGFQNIQSDEITLSDTLYISTIEIKR